MGQSLDVLGTCDGTYGKEKAQQKNRKGVSCAWDDDVGVGCASLEEAAKNAVATANRGGGKISDEVLVNHELLQHARQGNVKGLSAALDHGAWTETRRPLVMKPQKPDVAAKGSKGGYPCPDKDDNIGMTALMFSSHCGSAECVRRLIWANADVCAIEEDGWSALHFAANQGHLEVCAALLQGKADPQLVNSDDLTALDVASEEDSGFVEALAKLIAKHDTRDAREEEGEGEELKDPPLPLPEGWKYGGGD